MEFWKPQCASRSDLLEIFLDYRKAMACKGVADRRYLELLVHPPLHDSAQKQSDPGGHQHGEGRHAGYPPGLGGGMELPGTGKGGAASDPKGLSGMARNEGAHGNGSNPTDPVELLMKGMTQLQQAYLGRPEGDVKSSVDLPMMPAVSQDSAVEFADWVYEAEQIIGSLSDKASLWFSACLEVARTAYDAYNIASPLERLTLTPTIPGELRDPRWSRLERKVMTLLFGIKRKRRQRKR